VKNWTLAIIAACALCCAPLLIPALSGVALFATTLAGRPLTLDTILCALPMAILAAIAVFTIVKALQRHRTGCRTDGDCGCKP